MFIALVDISSYVWALLQVILSIKNVKALLGLSSWLNQMYMLIGVIDEQFRWFEIWDYSNYSRRNDEISETLKNRAHQLR